MKAKKAGAARLIREAHTTTYEAAIRGAKLGLQRADLTTKDRTTRLERLAYLEAKLKELLRSKAKATAVRT